MQNVGTSASEADVCRFVTLESFVNFLEIRKKAVIGRYAENVLLSYFNYKWSESVNDLRCLFSLLIKR